MVVNFSRGANPPRNQWKPAKLRTKEDSERCYRIFNTYIDRLKAIPGAKFVTTMDLLNLYQPPAGTAPDAEHAKQLLRESLTWHENWSAAELAAAALKAPVPGVGAPLARRESTYRGTTISRADFERALGEAQKFIRSESRLPVEIWIGDDTLSIGDFVATAIQDRESDPFARDRRTGGRNDRGDDDPESGEADHAYEGEAGGRQGLSGRRHVSAAAPRRSRCSKSRIRSERYCSPR